MPSLTTEDLDNRESIERFINERLVEAIEADPEYQRLKAEDEAEVNRILYGDPELKNPPRGILRN